MAAFSGFHPETFTFLAGLTHNNERTWFEAHRSEYERHVLEPALALITDLDPVVQAVSPFYRGVAKKVGGSLMRIYRDTRFSRDKTPYKTNVGIQLRHRDAADVHAPGFYVHLDLEQTFFGAGSWHPLPPELLQIRRRIADKPDEYRDGLARATASLALHPAGESLKKIPKGFEEGHPLDGEIRRKDFLLSENLSPDLFMGPQLVEALAGRIHATGSYMGFLCRALGAPF